MTKVLINIEKKINSFICPICKILVDPKKGKPITIETEEVIIKTWDYGHQHKKTIQFIEGYNHSSDIENI